MPAPACLFHEPKVTFAIKYKCELRADWSFSTHERMLLLMAAYDLEKFTNFMFKFIIKFDLNPTDIQSINDESVIVRACEDHPELNVWDEHEKVKILGLCLHKENNSVNIYLACDRMHDDTTMRTTMIHELAHLIGLGHTPRHSILHAVNYKNVLYPTIIDAIEFSKIYNCNTEELRYFKL